MRESEEIEVIEKIRAKNRQGIRSDLNIVAILPLSEKGKTRDKVSARIGMKPRTYDKARFIWNSAKAGNKRARKAIGKIDDDEATINGAYNKLKKTTEITGKG